jgi:hypothetical protein
MTHVKSYITEIFSDSINALQKAHSLLEHNNVTSIHIGKSFFNKDYMHKQDIRTSTEHKLLFDELKDIKRPVLYWFEFKTVDNKKIRARYELYRADIKENRKDYRNTSSHKTHFEPNTTTLYVGKVETGFWGRLITHLGYALSEKTAGMQLCHWYDLEAFGDLTLHYITFDSGMKYLVATIEKELAKELKPLLGRY